MSTPSPTPSEKHIWTAASIQTCAEQGHRQSGGERSLRGARPAREQGVVMGWTHWGGPTDGHAFAARGSREQGRT